MQDLCFGLHDAIHDDNDVKTVLVQWLAHQTAEFYEEGIQKLVVRYDNCLNVGENYDEKQIKVQSYL